MNLEVMLQTGWTTERLCANETIIGMKLYVVFHNLPRPENLPTMGTVVFPIIIETFAYCVLNCSTLCTVCLQPTRLPITHHPGLKGQHYDGNDVGHVALRAGFV